MKKKKNLVTLEYKTQDVEFIEISKCFIDAPLFRHCKYHFAVARFICSAVLLIPTTSTCIDYDMLKSTESPGFIPFTVSAAPLSPRKGIISGPHCLPIRARTHSHTHKYLCKSAYICMRSRGGDLYPFSRSAQSPVNIQYRNDHFIRALFT